MAERKKVDVLVVTLESMWKPLCLMAKMYIYRYLFLYINIEHAQGGGDITDRNIPYIIFRNSDFRNIRNIP